MKFTKRQIESLKQAGRDFAADNRDQDHDIFSDAAFDLAAGTIPGLVGLDRTVAAEFVFEGIQEELMKEVCGSCHRVLGLGTGCGTCMTPEGDV